MNSKHGAYGIKEYYKMTTKNLDGLFRPEDMEAWKIEHEKQKALGKAMDVMEQMRDAEKNNIVLIETPGEYIFCNVNMPRRFTYHIGFHKKKLIDGEKFSYDRWGKNAYTLPTLHTYFACMRKLYNNQILLTVRAGTRPAAGCNPAENCVE